MENPAVVLADTLDVIVPSEFDDGEPLAFQHQATKDSAESLYPAAPVPRVNPPDINDCKPSISTASA